MKFRVTYNYRITRYFVWTTREITVEAESKQEAIQIAKGSLSASAFDFKATKMQWKPSCKQTTTVAGDYCEAQGWPKTKRYLQKAIEAMKQRKP